MKQRLAMFAAVLIPLVVVACGTTSGGAGNDAGLVNTGLLNTGVETGNTTTGGAKTQTPGESTVTDASEINDQASPSVVIVDSLEPYTVEVIAVASARLRAGPGTQYDEVGALLLDKTAFTSHKTPSGWLLLTKDDQPYGYVWHKLVTVISVYE